VRDVALFVLRDPYPEGFFAPLSVEEMDRVRVVLRESGVRFAMERLHAQWARHLAGVYEQIKAEQDSFNEHVKAEQDNYVEGGGFS